MLENTLNPAGLATNWNHELLALTVRNEVLTQVAKSFGVEYFDQLLIW